MDIVDPGQGLIQGTHVAEGDVAVPAHFRRDHNPDAGDAGRGVGSRRPASAPRRWRRRKVLIPAAIILAVILAAGGVVAAHSLTPSAPPSSALSRFFDPNVPDRYDTTAGGASGYVKQQILGYIPNDQAANTHPVFSCLYSHDHFLSSDPGCEGYQTLGRIGWVYVTPPASLQTTPLYRCWTTDQRDHFVSNDPYCEGQLLYGLLGYALQQP